MSRYICFTKLKYLIFINGGSTLPSGDSSAVLMPPILEKYANMLFQVHQSSTALSSSPHLYFDGTRGLNDMMDYNQTWVV
jgi:hypothetical protein